MLGLRHIPPRNRNNSLTRSFQAEAGLSGRYLYQSVEISTLFCQNKRTSPRS